MDPITLSTIASVGLSLFDVYNKNEQQKKQNELLERQQQLSEQEYFSHLQQQQDWSEKYGSIEHNMLHYVQGLNATTIYGIHEGGLKQSYETARKNVDSHLASRGFDVVGGVHAGMFTQLADMEAQATVELQQKSEQYVLQAQQGALQGNPQPNPASTSGMQNSLSNQFNANASANAGMTKAYEDLAGTLGSGYQDFERAKKKRMKLEETRQESVNSNTTFKTVDTVDRGLQWG